MIKIYETAIKVCTEQLYSLLVFPCIVKYKSKLSPLLAYFLFLSVYVACEASDTYRFLLFAPVVLIPFSPTSVLSLQSLFGLLYGSKQAA